MRRERFQLLLYPLAHLKNVVAAGAGNAYAQAVLAIPCHCIAGNLLIAAPHICNISYAQLVVVVALNEHICNLLHIVKAVVHSNPYPSGAIVKIARIRGGILPVQSLNNLHRQHSKVCHLILFKVHIYALGPCAIYIYSCNALYLKHLALNVLGIIVQLLVVHSISHKGVEHSKDISKIILYRENGGAGGESWLHILHLSAQKVPLLLQLRVAYRRLKLYCNNSHICIGGRLYMLQGWHLPYRLLQKVCHLQLHLMRRGSRIGYHHKGLLHPYCRVFQFWHSPKGKDASNYQKCNKRIHQSTFVKGPIAYIHYISPPTLLSDPLLTATALWPSSR